MDSAWLRPVWRPARVRAAGMAPGDLAALPLVGLATSGSCPPRLAAALSRWQEHRADAFALELTGGATEFRPRFGASPPAILWKSAPHVSHAGCITAIRRWPIGCALPIGSNECHFVTINLPRISLAQRASIDSVHRISNSPASLARKLNVTALPGSARLSMR